MPIKAVANGKTFTFPDGTSQEDAAEAIDGYFASNPSQSTQTQQPAQEPEKPQGYWSRVGENLKNEGAGLVRGAGSIGATIMTPFDAAARAMGVDPNSAVGSIVGRTDRRQSIDDGLQSMGANPDSGLYKAGKIAGEIAGTAGVGGVVAKPIIAASSSMPALAPIGNAIASSGMRAGAAGKAADMATRVAGGAITGGASAGLVDPESASLGAMIGGGLPMATKALGAIGSKIGAALSGGRQTPEMAQAVEQARQSGYVIPPTQANPTLTNRLLEGFAGKLTTAQNASAKNQAVTNAKAARALGLDAETKLTPDVLNDIRQQAGRAYDAVSNTGVVNPDQTYFSALDDIAKPHVTASQGFPNARPSPVIELVEQLKSPQFDASAAVAKIKELRTMADDAYRQGNTDVGRASKSAATALESTLEKHLQQIGTPQALEEFRNARQLIAKTYTVEKALNPASGNVDAKKLADQLARKKPLSGELKEVAEFASQFKKAVQTPEQMGSLPQMSPLDWIGGASLSAATSNPLALAAVLARPAARGAALSPMIQNRLVQRPANQAIANALANPSARALLYRSAPVIGADQ